MPPFHYDFRGVRDITPADTIADASHCHDTLIARHYCQHYIFAIDRKPRRDLIYITL
jgi:hypothetical protein